MYEVCKTEVEARCRAQAASFSNPDGREYHVIEHEEGFLVCDDAELPEDGFHGNLIVSFGSFLPER